MGKNELPDSSRRKVLKISGAVAGSSIFANTAIAGDTSKTIIDQLAPQEEYQNGIEAITDVVLDDRNEQYLLSGEMYTPGGRDEGDGTWEFDFHLQGQGTCRRYYSSETPEDGWKKDRIGSHRIQLHDESGYANFKVATDADSLGGRPAEQYTAIEMSVDITEQLAYAAAGRAGKYVTGVIDAKNVYDALSNAYDEQKTDIQKDKPEFVWHYSDPYQVGDKHSDISHQIRFEYAIDYGYEPYMYVDQEMVGVNGTQAINWRIQTQAPDSAPSSLSVQETTNGESRIALPGAANMSARERKALGVKLLPREALNNIGYDIPKSGTVEGDMVWFMTKPPFSIEPETKTTARDEVRT